MTKETGVQDYQFKHPTRITLDSYHGIASGLMKLNDPLADGYMRVSDMRKNIVVTAEQPKRTYEYDELGPVRVSRLKLLKFGTSEGNGLSTLGRDNEDWVVTINDQAIWGQLPKDESLTTREAQFIEYFRNELRTASVNCLIREKLFNGEMHSPAVVMSLLGSVIIYPTIAAAEVGSVIMNKHPLELDILALLYALGGNLLCNTISYARAVLDMRSQDDQSLMVKKQLELFRMRIWPDFREPFVRHAFFEFFAPPVPVDRLVRGLFYNRVHGHNLLIAV